MPRKNDGGPAFPIPVTSTPAGDVFGSFDGEQGMTVRQYYKAQALQGMLSTEYVTKGMINTEDAAPRTVSTLADVCGVLADAMIQEDEDAATD